MDPLISPPTLSGPFLLGVVIARGLHRLTRRITRRDSSSHNAEKGGFDA